MRRNVYFFVFFCRWNRQCYEITQVLILHYKLKVRVIEQACKYFEKMDAQNYDENTVDIYDDVYVKILHNDNIYLKLN